MIIILLIILIAYPIFYMITVNNPAMRLISHADFFRNIKGNIKPARSLVEYLQVAEDNGAKRALISIENEHNFFDADADITEHVDPVFYAEPRAAAFKGFIFGLIATLWHTYASMLASSGSVDMYTLQRLLTHKDPRMTQRYAHLRDEALRQASEVVGNIILDATKKKDDKKFVNLEDHSN